MYMNSEPNFEIINNTNSIVELEKREKTELIDPHDNSVSTIATRIILVGIVLSWYIYLKCMIKSLIGLKRHKNFNFIFPFLAAAFAWANNTNDIFFYIYHPKSCYTFWFLFKATATLNWAPISWLQAVRLSIIAKIYLNKFLFIIITIITFSLSTIYCTFYFLNLSRFDYTTAPLMGCGVTNDGLYTYYVMGSDIVDSLFAFGAICIIIIKSIRGLRELNAKNDKLNNLVSQGAFQLLIITIGKIVIYPLIAITSYVPSFDIFWDVLSVVVIYFAYEMVNFPYDKDNQRNRIFARRFFYYLGAGIKSIRNQSSSIHLSNYSSSWETSNNGNGNGRRESVATKNDITHQSITIVEKTNNV